MYAINTVLLENTGLTLEQTAQKGMEQFQYLPEYESYYHTHGDTNYFHSVQISAGERQGDTIRLYYPDRYAHYADYDWLCVTLESQEDGSYRFVSNLPAEKPTITTVYPKGDPVLTISLEDLKPLEPEPVTVTRRENDCAERGYGIGITTENGEEYSFPALPLHRRAMCTPPSSTMKPAGKEAGRNGDVGCFFTYPAGSDVKAADAGKLLPLRLYRRGGLL